MIRIPGVQETAPSTVSLQAPLGQQVQQNEGLEMLGQTASMTGRQATRFAALGQQGMRNARVSKAKEGQTRAAQKIKELLEGRENGYLLKKGAAARDGIGDLEKALDAEYKKIAGAFDDDETRKMFEEAVALDFTRAKTAAGIHWSKQSQVANAAQSKVRYGQHKADIAAGDWGARVDLRDEINEYGQIVGLSPEQRDQLYNDTLSEAESSYVSTLMDEGDLDAAERELEKHGPRIERAQRASLGKRLRQERKSEAALDETKKRNAKAQSAVFKLIDRYAVDEDQARIDQFLGLPRDELSGAERHSKILADLEQQRRDNIDDPTKGLSAEEYITARTFLSNEMADVRAREKEAIASDLAVVEKAFTDDPTTTLDNLRKQHPDEVRRLGTSEEGRDMLRKLTTAQGKQEAAALYVGLQYAEHTQDYEEIKNRFPLDKKGVPQNLHQLVGLTNEQRGTAIDLIRRAHGLEPNDKGRLRKGDLVKARLGGSVWAHVNGDLAQPLDPMVVDDMVREMNRDLSPDKLGREPTADDERNWLESQLREGTYRYSDETVVPRAALRSLKPGILAGVKGLTVAGKLHPTDISMSVRGHLVMIAEQQLKKSNQGQAPSRRQAAQRAEALWLQLGSPTTLAEAKKAAAEYQGGSRDLIGSNLRKYQVADMLSAAGDVEALEIATLATPQARAALAREMAELRLRAELGPDAVDETRVETVMRRLLRGAQAYRNAKADPVTPEPVSAKQQDMIREQQKTPFNW
tara:strand:+ start:580 stop:2832 length:2253 start_codon:yes stop_codon:yes gene_type:complete